MNKKIGLFLTSVIFATLLAEPAFAEGWKQNAGENTWRYEKSDGTEAKNEWLWIDGNNDRIAECTTLETMERCFFPPQLQMAVKSMKMVSGFPKAVL